MSRGHAIRKHKRGFALPWWAIAMLIITFGIIALIALKPILAEMFG